MTAPRVNGAHRVYADRGRSWLLPAVLAATIAAVIMGIVVLVLVSAPSKPPDPVSTPAGAQPGAVPTTPWPGGMEVREDGPTETTTTGCAP